jgi:hypothetical protein
MIRIILGVLMLLLPFLLIFRFKDKRRGFVTILTLLIGAMLIISLILQLFGIFSKTIMLIIFLVINFFIILKTDFKKIKIEARKINPNNWYFIATFFIIFISLYAVHYNFSGTMHTIIDSVEVNNIRYTYPYYSDEWISASLFRYSINSGKIPMVNPLSENVFFPNFGFPFYTFGSGFYAVLGVDPVENFALIVLIAGLLICALVYFLLRLSNIGVFASCLSALSVIYLTNGQTMPGLWYFNPVNLGLIFLLLSITFIIINDKKMFITSAILSIIFYPPIAIFTLPLFLFLLKDLRKNKKYLLISFSLIVFVTLSIFLLVKSFHSSLALDYLKNRIFYNSLLENATLELSIFYIIPLIVLIFAMIGLFSKRKEIDKKIWILIPLFIGILLWIIYSQVFWRFLIEYERAVFITSVFIVLLSGFGFDYLFSSLKKTLKKQHIGAIIFILILFLFLFLSFSYTERTNWQKLIIKSTTCEEYSTPLPPANTYLHPADLELFKGITNKKFLSYGWKGLVVGVATDNYPVHTKGSTITNFYFDFDKFQRETCKNKLLIAKEQKWDYVYLEEIKCDGFELIGISIEGMHLYKIQTNNL